MNNALKERQLRKHKQLATGLFLLMLAIYLVTTYLVKQPGTGNYLGYIRAFAEAAMVGALADWFAVTALFHHPLGIPIPHTNLIENSKQRIGDNLGDFVVSNFLTSENLRPYIQNLKLSVYAANWLGKEKNKQTLVQELSRIVLHSLHKANDAVMISFLTKRAKGLMDEFNLQSITGNAIIYLLDKKEEEPVITLLASRVKQFIAENDELVEQKVAKESFFFIPKFVERKLAEKISTGLAAFFEEIEKDNDHRIRLEIREQLYELANDIQSSEKWRDNFSRLKSNLLTQEKLQQYAGDAWQAIKNSLQQELTDPASATVKYIYKNLDELAYNLNNDESLQKKIDGWIQYNAYKYILRNTSEVGKLISKTVGNWQGKALSEKLELEVGKDLQFIRINGTLVGGLVGLLIHTITELIW